VRAEAKKLNIPMAAYVRAVLAHRVFSKQPQPVLGEEWLINDEAGDVLLDV